MCEIQIAIAKNEKGITKKEVAYLELLNQYAQPNNHDATGYFNALTTHKEKGVFSLIDHLDDIVGQQYLVVHNRFMTQASAKKNRNNHPFQKGRWTLVHNGVIRNDNELRAEHKKIKKHSGCDSFSFLYLFESNYNKLLKTDLSESKRVLKAIKKTVKKIEGYFSIAVMNNLTGKLYYFKCSTAQFYFGYNRGKLAFCSTSQDSLDRLKDVGVITKITEAPSDTVFEVDFDKQKLSKIGKFKYEDATIWYQQQQPTTEWGFDDTLTSRQDLDRFDNILEYLNGTLPPYEMDGDQVILNEEHLFDKLAEYYWDIEQRDDGSLAIGLASLYNGEYLQ